MYFFRNATIPTVSIVDIVIVVVPFIVVDWLIDAVSLFDSTILISWLEELGANFEIQAASPCGKVLLAT